MKHQEIFIDYNRGRIYRFEKKYHTYKIVGSKDTYGYLRLRLNGKTVKNHRYIYEQFHDVKLISEQYINHINHVRNDNRICNLEIVNHQENIQYQQLLKRNTSGFKGVCWYKRDSKWQVQICLNGKIISLGFFDDIEIAKNVWIKKVKELNEAGYKFFIPDYQK